MELNIFLEKAALGFIALSVAFLWILYHSDNKVMNNPKSPKTNSPKEKRRRQTPRL